MEGLNLLEVFRAQVKRYETHELLASRAKDYADRFDSVVVNRVVSDHIEQAKAAGNQAILLYADMEHLLGRLGRECEGLRTSQVSPRSSLEELELRLLIGEIDDGYYESQTAPLMAYLAESDEQIVELEQTVVELSAPMAHWVEISRGSALLP